MKSKITGTLNCQYMNREGMLVQPTKVMYARTNITLAIKLFFMRMFYDWIEVEVLGGGE